MIRARALACLAVIGVLLPVTAAAANRYDPRLRFRTISTPRFDIHFHQGGEAEARRLAVMAEEIAGTLDRTLGAPAGRVHVILVNQTDLANGWATPLPFNVIEMTAAAPRGESLIGNTDDWLRVVFTHEYTHVVHLGRGRGWIGGLRRVFGRMPLLFPNAFAPLWQVEGIATFMESDVTGQGRLHAGDFRLITQQAAASEAFLSVDQAGGGLLDWPGGHAPYAYGGAFHEFLAGRFGEDSLRDLTDATAGRPPYFGATAFRRVFGRSLGDLWREFEAHTSARAAAPDEGARATRLTRHGFTVAGPRHARDGRLYYSVATPHEFPALMALPRGDGGAARPVAPRYLGSRLGFAGDELVFDQVEFVRSVGLQSDLYAAHAGTGEVRRLTREARAGDPDVSPDGLTIVCTVQRDDGRWLATMAVPPRGASGGPAVLAGADGEEWASPRWSPDGRLIAAERRRRGGPSEIVLVDSRSGAVRSLVSSAAARLVTPVWTPDGGSVLFARGDREGFAVHAVDVESGALSRLNGTGSNARSPDVSPDGARLVYVGYTADGDDLFSVPLGSASWTRVDPERAEARSGGNPVGAGGQAGPYSPWRTLAPRFWIPTLESDGGETVMGAATAGADALGRHVYAVESGWSTARARPDWQAAYAYDRWRPTIFARVADDTDPWRGGELRTREAGVGLLFPVRRVRWTQSVLGAFHAATDSLACEGCDDDGARAARRALRAGWIVDAARGFGYSISEEEGWSASATVELTREALGADGDAGAATGDVRGYVRLGSRHAVLAARAAGATAWGDEVVRRTFSASGHGPQPRAFEFGSGAVGMIRGVDDGDLAGAHAVVVNVDYRVPLLRLERGIGTLPFFARTLHGAVFIDTGHAWTGPFRAADLARAAGAELSLDTVVGHVLPLTFTAGVAFRDAPGEGRGAVLFGRIGRAF